MNLNVKPDGMSWGKLIFVGVMSRFWTITAIFSVVVLLGLWFDFLPPLPREAQILALVAPFGIVAGWAAGTKAEPGDRATYHYIIDVEVPGNVGDKGALYELSEADFREFEVLEDSLEDWSPFLHVAKGVHIDELYAEEGTWAAAMDDRELMKAFANIKKLRGQLEQDAKKGFVLEANAFIMIRSAVQSGIRRIVDTFEKGTLPDDGEALNEEIDETLEEFELSSLEESVKGDPLEELDFDLEDVLEDDLDDDQLPADLGLPSPEGGEADDD